MKKIIIYTFCFILLLFTESVVRPLTAFGVSPMYVLCGVAAIGILEKEKYGAIFGLVFGLFCDFAEGSLFGSQALSFMITGFVAGILAENVLSVGMLSTAVIAEGSVFLFGTLNTLIYVMLEDGTAFADVLLYILLPKLLLTFPFAFFIYFPMKLVSRISGRERL